MKGNEVFGLTRRDFIKATSAVLAAFGVQGSGLLKLREAAGLEAEDGGAPVLWLQAQCCSGCSISLLNSISVKSIDDLLVNDLDLQFHPTLMAAAGSRAVAAAEKTYRRGGYVLVVEGSIPQGAGGAYCRLWSGLSASKAIERYTSRASLILAVGTCAAFGGIASGNPNPTEAEGLEDEYDGKRVVRIPGCPSHPDWVVGTIAYVLANGKAPTLDTWGRPTQYFQSRVHDRCPLRSTEEAGVLGQIGCLEELGCKGKITRADCPSRKWNASAQGGVGVNWCIGAGAPCYGCTEPGFPDGMSPFYELGEGDDD